MSPLRDHCPSPPHTPRVQKTQTTHTFPAGPAASKKTAMEICNKVSLLRALWVLIVVLE